MNTISDGNAKGKWMREFPDKESLSGIAATQGASGAEAPLPCVLLVEDDLSARWLMRSALKGRCNLLSATTGEEALEIYQRHRPEVVVLDFCLPRQKGDAVLRMLLAADPCANVVAMSGGENLPALRRMMAQGARAMLVKPFAKEEFLRRVLDAAPADTFFTKGD